jgi:hypothetical protein
MNGTDSSNPSRYYISPNLSTLNQKQLATMSLEQRKRQKVEKAQDASAEDDEKHVGGAEDEMDRKNDGQDVELQRNSDGDAFFELSSSRRISVRKFKGTTLVDIREVRGI